MKIKLKDIKVPHYFKEVSQKKLNERIQYFEKYGEFKTPLVVNQENVIIDGYTTYLVAQIYGLNKINAVKYWE